MQRLGKIVKGLVVVGMVGVMMIIGPQEALAANEITANVEIYQNSEIAESERCYGPYFTTQKKLIVKIYDITYNDKKITGPDDVSYWQGLGFTINIRGSGWITDAQLTGTQINNDGEFIVELNPPGLKEDEVSRENTIVIRGSGVVKQGTNINILYQEKLTFYKEIDESTCWSEPGAGSYDLCNQIPEDQIEARARCAECLTGVYNNDQPGVWTAIGCIPQSAEGIIAAIIKIGMIIAGAIVLIMILIGSFMLSTSQGDPKRTQEAREMITSAIIGLLFIIFSITILQFIGVSVLKIPGFGE